jgi:hypothetical protein
MWLFLITPLMVPSPEQRPKALHLTLSLSFMLYHQCLAHIRFSISTSGLNQSIHTSPLHGQGPSKCLVSGDSVPLPSSFLIHGGHDCWPRTGSPYYLCLTMTQLTGPKYLELLTKNQRWKSQRLWGPKEVSTNDLLGSKSPGFMPKPPHNIHTYHRS